jgi:putative two-component system response regulator
VNDATEPLGAAPALLASQTQQPEHALAELARALDPEREAPLPQSPQIFARALELANGLGPETGGPALAESLLAIARYAYVSGQHFKGLAPSQRAVNLARGLEAPPLLRRALSIQGTLLAEAGNLPLAIETYAEALAIAIELNDPRAESVVCNNLGAALLYSGQYEDALTCFQRVVARSERNEALRIPLGMALSNIALACLHLEDYTHGLHIARQALAVQGDLATPSAQLRRVLVESTYVQLLLEVDAQEQARQRCEVANRIARASGLQLAILWAGLVEGLYQVHSGAVDAGLARLSELIEVARDLKGSVGDALIVMVKANEVAGRADVALVYLRELMMHTKRTQQQSALLHHRLHLEQMEQRAQVATSSAELMAQREIKLRTRLGEQVAQQELMKARVEILERLAVSADLRADRTGRHSYRVGRLAALLAQGLGWDGEAVFLLELAARLHDIGKIGIPERLLGTRRRLTQAELELAQSHVLIGAEILAQSDLQHMRMAEEIARFHHECWDGSGYPFKLAYSAIPAAARITALADTFDELTHDTGRQSARPVRDALREIGSQRGRQFDPDLTDRFVALVIRLQQDHPDLDAYLGRSADRSPLIQARRKIASTLKELETV